MSYESTRSKRLSARVANKPCVLQTPLGPGVLQRMHRATTPIYGDGPDKPPTSLEPGEIMYALIIDGVEHNLRQVDVDALN